LVYAWPCGRGAAAQDLPRLIPRVQTPNVCLQRTSCLKGSARDPAQGSRPLEHLCPAPGVGAVAGGSEHPAADAGRRRSGLASDVVTLSRIMLALGVRDRGRGEFWRYLRCALTQHRERLAEAVRLAALGYHCRQLTEGLGKSWRRS
jgi:Domain of unknown function (DUF4070)